MDFHDGDPDFGCTMVQDMHSSSVAQAEVLRAAGPLAVEETNECSVKNPGNHDGITWLHAAQRPLPELVQSTALSLLARSVSAAESCSCRSDP